MNIVKWENNFVPSFSSLLDSFFDKDFVSTNAAREKTIPAVNIYEDDTAFLVDLAAPGLDKKDFNIDLKENILTISAEREEENKEDSPYNRVSKREFSFNSFRRTFTLPDLIVADKISANYNEGILKVKIPKKEAKKIEARKIQIS